MKNLVILLLISCSTLPFVYGFAQSKSNGDKSGLTASESEVVTGEELFQENCAVCHGIDRKGNPPVFPSLVSVDDRYSKEQILELLKTGRNIMPSFAHLSSSERDALTGFLYGESTKAEKVTAITPEQMGERLFVANCARCHRASPDDSAPPDQRDWGMQPMVLGGITLNYKLKEFEQILDIGPCYMPSFNYLNIADKKNIYVYLDSFDKNEGTTYQVMSMSRCRNSNYKPVCCR